MGCGGSKPADDEEIFQNVHVPEIAGNWVPAHIDAWRGCPAPLEHRVQGYCYKVNADGSWVK